MKKKDKEEVSAVRAEKRQNSRAIKLFSLGLALCVLAYFAVQIYSYFVTPYSFYTVYAYQVEDAQSLTGWVVRDEAVLPSSGGGIPSLELSEGERVGAGKRLAVIYRDQSSLDQQTQLQGLRQQLEQLQYAQEAAADSEATLRLDHEIAASILALRSDLSADNLAYAEDHMADLRSLVLKRDYSYQDATDLNAQIKELSAQIKSLQATVSSGATAVKAPRSGTYSAVVDGYEKTLTPAMLEELTPKQLDAVTADASVSSDIGKLIYGDTWYFAAAVDSKTAAGFTAGAATTLRFTKGLERDLPVRVDSVGPEEGGRRVVVFSGRKYLQQITQLRRQTADVIRSTYSGLRIPQDALRVVTSTVKDEETGEESTVQTTGVYCVVGKAAKFKPVKVLYAGEGFSLVQSTLEDVEGKLSDSQEKTRLRSLDEVIVTAEELYDGKVVR